MDWTIYEGSRIATLPPLIRSAALMARNAKVSFDTRFRPLKDHFHRQDGMTTRHNDGFRDSPIFRSALNRANAASGWNYMIPYRLHQALWCARVAMKADGDFVELGTGRGYLMSGVMDSLANEWATSGRSLHLFDTFISYYPNSAGEQRDNGVVSPHYATSFEDVGRNFSNWPRVFLHKGNVLQTLPEVEIASVAFLHIDLNHPVPEVFGLRHLWDRIPRGGVVLLDDYAHASHVTQYRAMNDLAKELGFDILSTPTGQGIIVK